VSNKEKEGRENLWKSHIKKAWQLGMDIAVDIYKASARFPGEERFGLTSQMRRSGVSVPSNVAEGAGRNTKKEFINFLHIAQGSLSELDTQLELSRRLEFIDDRCLEVA
jgi:four helix bundle protein